MEKLMLQPTYADLIRPTEKTRALIYDAVLVVAGSLLMAALSLISINVPGSPVPITAQTLGVMLIGALLGWKRGAASMALFLAEGALGLVFFAEGTTGPAVLAGTTGGYLVGFVVAAGVVGWLAERGWDRAIWSTMLAMVIGNVIIYVFGVTWLATILKGLDNAITFGLLPFIPGDLAKIAIATV